MAAPLDVTIQGMALNSIGLTANNTISGVGLNTFGFLWDCSAIWMPSDDTITTSWIDCVDPNATIETCTD